MLPSRHGVFASMESDLSLILQIKEVDLRIAELERELSALPKQVAEVEAQLETHRRVLAEKKAALASNNTERRTLEGEIQVSQQKAARLQEQMTEARTNEQYRAFRNEITFVQKEIRKAEDRALDTMESAERLEGEVGAAEQALAEEAKTVAVQVEETKSRFKGDQDALRKALRARKALAQKANAELLKIYDRARVKLGGAAVSPLVENRCGSCNMIIRPRVQQILRNGTRALECEFCGCLLYHREPAAAVVEDPAGDAGIV